MIGISIRTRKGFLRHRNVCHHPGSNSSEAKREEQEIINIFFQHLRFYLRTRVMWNMSGTSLSKEKRGFRGHSAPSRPKTQTGFHLNFNNRFCKDAWSGQPGLLQAVSIVWNQQLHSIKNWAYLICICKYIFFIALKRIWHKESPYDRMQARVPEKAVSILHTSHCKGIGRNSKWI